MVGSLSFSMLELLWMFSDFPIGTGIFWHAPTSITHVPSALLITGLHLTTLDLMSELTVMGMMLESGYKPTLIEEWSPVSEALFNGFLIILH